MGRITEDSGDAVGLAVGINEGGPVDVVVARPSDLEAGISLSLIHISEPTRPY